MNEQNKEAASTLAQERNLREAQQRKEKDLLERGDLLKVAATEAKRKRKLEQARRSTPSPQPPRTPTPPGYHVTISDSDEDEKVIMNSKFSVQKTLPVLSVMLISTTNGRGQNKNS
ncbi:hypothetical protein CRE_17281 [Caenorhabditis remanei]|uniref:Uncharacterized protein n=1 Tax=Caenorhabditis remanei TaxID=31234 RepID=E3MAI6_CAERE|nr:hypothetical protein CRE_17281 [Caenorhabditis remanei]